MSPGHLGQAAGSVVKPGEDLVPFPPGVGAQLLKLVRGVLSGPRGLCACVLGPCFGVGGALTGLRGLRDGLAASVVSGVPSISDTWLAPAKRPLIDIAMSAIAAPTMSCMFGTCREGNC